MTMKRVLVVLLLSLPVLARELKGVTLPDTREVAGKPLKLAGMGVRNKFGFTVYVAGLYLEDPGADPLAKDQARQIDMVALRDIEKARIVEGLVEGFEKNGNEKLKPQLDKLTAAIGDLKSGKSLQYTYVPGKGTTVNGVTIEGKDFG